MCAALSLVFFFGSDFGCVPNGLERCAAVLRRLLAQQERGLTVPLFAWGRMTLTVKPLYCGDGQNVRPVELWKPKRHEIVAVMAYLYMGRTTDLNAQLGFTDVEVCVYRTTYDAYMCLCCLTTTSLKCSAS